MTSRLPRQQALEYLSTTTILYYPGWRGYKGINSAKMFEYIVTGLPIQISPGDNDVINELISKTGTEMSEATSEEMSSILFELYSIWLSKMNIPVSPIALLKNIPGNTRQKICLKLF